MPIALIFFTVTSWIASGVVESIYVTGSDARGDAIAQEFDLPVPMDVADLHALFARVNAGELQFPFE